MAPPESSHVVVPCSGQRNLVVDLPAYDGQPLAGLPSDSGEYNFTRTQVDTNSEQLAFSSRRGKHVDIEMSFCVLSVKDGESNQTAEAGCKPCQMDRIRSWYTKDTHGYNTLSTVMLEWCWHKFISIYLGAVSSPKKCRIWGFCNSRRERETNRKKEKKETKRERTKINKEQKGNKKQTKTENVCLCCNMVIYSNNKPPTW